MAQQVRFNTAAVLAEVVGKFSFKDSSTPVSSHALSSQALVSMANGQMSVSTLFLLTAAFNPRHIVGRGTE